MRIHFEYLTEDVVRCSVSGPSWPARHRAGSVRGPSRDHGRGGTARAVQQRTADHRRHRRRSPRADGRAGGVVVGGQRPAPGRRARSTAARPWPSTTTRQSGRGYALVYTVGGETRYVRASLPLGRRRRLTTTARSRGRPRVLERRVDDRRGGAGDRTGRSRSTCPPSPRARRWRARSWSPTTGSGARPRRPRTGRRRDRSGRRRGLHRRVLQRRAAARRRASRRPPSQLKAPKSVKGRKTVTVTRQGPPGPRRRSRDDHAHGEQEAGDTRRHERRRRLASAPGSRSARRAICAPSPRASARRS